MNAITPKNTSPPLRALEVMHDLPADHWLMQMDSDRHAPHLKAGEWAVVSPDTTLVLGELHVWNQTNRPTIWALLRVPDRMRVEADEPCVYVGNLSKPRRLPNGDIDWRYPVHLSEGPCRRSYAEQQIIGRVVGVYVGDLPLLMPVFQTLSMHLPAHHRYPAWLREQHSAENAGRRAAS